MNNLLVIVMIGCGSGMLACGVADPGAGLGGGSSFDSRCSAPCAARASRGCAGFAGTCETVCTAAFAAARAEGACRPQAETLEVCRHSSAVLELGCAPSTEEIEMVCAEQRQALDACRDQRDG